MVLLFLCAVALVRGEVIVADSFDGTEDQWHGAPLMNDPSSSWSESGGLGANILQSWTGDGGIGAAEFIYQDDSDFTGDWSAMGAEGVKRITFDFYSDSGIADNSPGLVEVYFMDAGTGERWFYHLTPTAGWQAYTVEVNYAYGWYNAFLDNEAGFLSSVQDVGQVGIMVAYQPGVNDQGYGIDDFTLHDVGAETEPDKGSMFLFR